jgi:hypothetical protein
MAQVGVILGELHGAGLVRAHYAGRQRNRCRRAMNRLASDTRFMPPLVALDHQLSGNRGGNVQRSGEAQVPACLTPSAGFARCAEHECRAPALHLGGQTQELSFHRVDLDEVCRDIVIAAALAGYQAEAAARECRRRTCAA